MDNKEPDNSNILVELDALFDTRLPLIYLISPTIAGSIAQDGSYFERVKDVFGYLSEDIFKPIYNNRNKKLLELATPTEMFTLVKEYIITANHLNRSTGGEDPVILYVNIHPYNLSLEEQETMIDVIRDTISKDVIIKLVKMDTTELTPSWVEDNVGYLIMYHGLDWLEYHIANQNIAKTPLIGISLLIPTIVSYVINDNDITKELFTTMMKQMSTVIRLGFIKNSYFSQIQKKE